MFSRSKYPKNILFNFENRSTGHNVFQSTLVIYDCFRVSLKYLWDTLSKFILLWVMNMTKSSWIKHNIGSNKIAAFDWNRVGSYIAVDAPAKAIWFQSKWNLVGCLTLDIFLWIMGIISIGNLKDSLQRSYKFKVLFKVNVALDTLAL